MDFFNILLDPFKFYLACPIWDKRGLVIGCSPHIPREVGFVPKKFRVVWSDWRFTLPIGVKTLIAFILITAVLTGGFYYFISVKFSSHIRRDALAELRSNLQGALSLYQSRPEQMKFGMLQAASEDAVKAALKRRDQGFFRRILNVYSGVRPYVDLWAIVDAEGKVVARRNGNAGDLLEINGIIGKAISSGRPVISTEAVSRDVLLREDQALASGIESIGLMQLAVVPVIDNGRTTGAFITGILLNGKGWLPDTIHKYFDVNASVLVIGPNSKAEVVAAASVPGAIFAGHTELDKEISSLVAKGSKFIGETELWSEGALLAVEPILDMNGTPIGALAVANRSAKAQARLTEMRTQILVVAAVGLLFSVFLAAITFRDTHNPVRAIRGAMKETASGNLDVELEIRTKDEFESIGQGFNSMVRSIKEREERIESFNQLSKVLLEFSDPETLLENALSKMMEFTGSQIGAAYVYNENTKALTSGACSGVAETDLAILMRGEGLAGRCIAEQRTILIGLDEAGALIEASFVKIRPAGLAAFCMAFKDKPRGVILLGSTAPYSEAILRHTEQLVNQVAIALDNALVHKEVEKLSVTDHLTGVFNRRRFSEVLADEFNRAARYKYELGILMVDVDDFKAINDTYGHQQGDIVLAELSWLLKENTRSTDIWARYGGEEFVGLVTHSGPDGVHILAEKLLKVVENHDFTGLKGQRVTVSVGVGMFPHEGAKIAEDVIKVADENLYEAKRNGKNQVVITRTQAERMKLVKA